MDKDSTLAAYWPGILYESSGIKAMWWGPQDDGFGYPKSPESLSKDSAVGGGPMAMLPLQRVSPPRNNSADSDLQLLYRRDDGFLYEFDRWKNGTVIKNDRKTIPHAVQLRRRYARQGC